MTDKTLRRRLFAFYTKRTGLVTIPVAPKLREDPKGLEPAPPKLDAAKAAKGVTIPSKGAP